MSKTYLALLTTAGLIILMLACVLTPNNPGDDPAITLTSPPPHPPVELTPTVPAVQKGIRVTTKESKEQSDDPKYSIELKYPFLEEASDDRAVGFNDEITAYLDNLVSGFKNNLSQIPNTPADKAVLSYLNIDFEVIRSDETLVSILLRSDMYTSGSTHSYPLYHSINYYIPDGRLVDLDELFINNAPYLEKLSVLCVEDLKKQGKYFFEEGARPIEENYTNWNIDAHGLLITFDVYKVAPYAAGAPRVAVPFSALSGLLSKEFPVELK